MFNKALTLDSKLFVEKKRIQAKRPSEYWLEFLKKHILIKQKSRFGWVWYLYLIPLLLCLILLVVILIGNTSLDFEDLTVTFFVSLIITTVAVVIVSTKQNQAFVNPNSFDHLAKFIVKIKGDTFKNLIGIHLDISTIENEANLMDLEPLGLKKTRQTKYAPYQLERYQANLRLKDDSFCSVSLYQMSLKTTTTKRRSSGKTKTKSKHKHKFYYILSLKLSAAAYQVASAAELLAFKGAFEVSNRTENGFHLVKIKYKEKTSFIPSEITEDQKQKTSIFTEMMDFIFERKIVTPTSNLLTP